jgi:hypothetical protein
MLENLIKKLQSLATPRPPFDPSRFNDPVAMQTTWTPAKSGGANFRTHKLVEIDFNRVEFKPSLGALAFYLIFFVAGAVVLVIFPYAQWSSGKNMFSADLLVPVLIGFVFAAVGIGMLYFGTAPIVFDKSKGCFWKGRTVPDGINNSQVIKHFAHIADIHALQLVSEYCSGNKSSYYSYELNLVLRNGNRINVVDHGNCGKLKEDAQRLSEFLSKPVWDAI